MFGKAKQAFRMMFGVAPQSNIRQFDNDINFLWGWPIQKTAFLDLGFAPNREFKITPPPPYYDPAIVWPVNALTGDVFAGIGTTPLSQHSQDIPQELATEFPGAY